MKMSKIVYIKGSATNPIDVSGPKLLIHCCNDILGWGSGFVLAISKRWDKPELEYRKWNNLKLGMIQVVDVEPDIAVVNMVGQRSTGIQVIEVGLDRIQIPPVRYESIRECLYKVAAEAIKRKASVVGPRFCCGLAGGTWDRIEPIIQETLISKGIPVYIYDPI
jgi:O-acetyl-ADP-ribose deacetylase (regulator of RNase III)